MSPAVMVTWWCSPRAIRPSAESGSPCDPVDDQHDLLGRHRGGLVQRRPSARARRAAARGRGPRPCCGPSSGRRGRPCGRASARSRAPAGCGARGWRSWRRSAAAMARAKTSSSTGPMLRSGVTKPGTSALVESDSSRSMPASPSRAKAPRSVRTPSSGSWSILKSPVCTSVPGRGVHGDGERVGDRVVDRRRTRSGTARRRGRRRRRPRPASGRSGARAASPRPGRG